MTNTITLQEIVAKTTDLPAIPATALAVMREADRANANAQTVSRYLSQDQALAAKVLRLANSAYFGLSRKVNSVPEAVVVLGMRAVRNLCMVASTYPWLSRPVKGYALEPKQMWAHAFGVATAAQILAEKTHAVGEDLAFTAGLLHDLGKVALGIWLENKLPAMLKIATAMQEPFDAIERKVLGYDHTDVGGFIGEAWNLPSPIVAAMRYHHRPDECPGFDALVDIVHVGDYLAMSMGLGLGGDGLFYQFSENALTRLRLDPEDLNPLADDFLERYERQERLFEDV